MVITVSILVLAAFFAGLVDSIAGGGGLITLPALLAVGLPPHVALGTNKFQMACGTSFAIANFHRKAQVVWRIAVAGIPGALIGSIIGAKLTLFLSPDLLGKVLVLVLPPATALMFASKVVIPAKAGIQLTPRHSDASRNPERLLIPFLTSLIIGCYDGFFGPGTGTFMILGLVIFSAMPLVKASATAKTFNLASNAGALAVFILNRDVNYPLAIAMAVANIGGNLFGSHLAVKRGATFVNKALLISLILLFIYLVKKYW
jgi:uncharacterized membrane protein YfcA